MKCGRLILKLFIGMVLLQGINPVCSLDNNNQIVKSQKVESDTRDNPSAKADVEQIKKQLIQQDKTIRQLIDSLAIAQSESQMFQKQLQDYRLQKEILGGSLTDSQLQERLVESVRNLYVSEQEKKRLQSRLEDMKEALRILLKSAEFADIQARAALEVELRLTSKLLEEIQKGKIDSLPLTDLNNAVIMNVNSGLALVILNVGRVQGVQLNMPFVILRNDIVIGNIRIIEVREKFSGAVIERFKAGEEIREGDRAKVETNRP